MATRAATLEMASDGLPARRVGAWSKEKLHYVARYCAIFNGGMQYKWPTRAYIDLFCGPGRCRVERTGEEIDGSPVIAQKCRPGFTHYVFNDLDPEALGALRRRTAALGTEHVDYLNLDCNHAVEGVVAVLDGLSPAWQQLSLCFIDPTNWQISFDSVTRLTANRRMDLIALFHSGAMKRAAQYAPRGLTAFFGDDPADPEWSRRYWQSAPSMRTRALLDHYRGRLRSLGYVGFHDTVSVELENDGVPLYQMLFASKHPRGEDFWDKIAVKQHSGQMRMDI